MNRRAFGLGALGVMLAPCAKAQDGDKVFPPRPLWRPSFQQSLDRVADRLHYYLNGKRDFAVFANGTCAILAPGLSDQAAAETATEMLSEIINYHPDMTPTPMDDGNLLVRYRKMACNVVLDDVAKAHWAEIDLRHLDGLTTDEVLLTPQGANVFDDVGKKGLLGRCYMFMDALDPYVMRVERSKP